MWNILVAATAASAAGDVRVCVNRRSLYDAYMFTSEK